MRIEELLAKQSITILSGTDIKIRGNLFTSHYCSLFVRLVEEIGQETELSPKHFSLLHNAIERIIYV